MKDTILKHLWTIPLFLRGWLNMKNIVEHKVYSTTQIKKKFGFRVLLKFDDGTEETRQFSGFLTKKEANAEREKIIAQLVTKTFIIEKKERLSQFLIEWLESDIKVRTAANTYDSYRNAILNHIIPILGNVYLTEITRMQIKNMYEKIAEKSHRIASISKTIMNTSLRYAVNKGKISENVAIGVSLPKTVKTNAYHTRAIKESSTLNLQQLIILIEASKGTQIYMQILFAALMGLRKSEINGLKYSDVDFVHQKLHVSRQLGRLPNSDDVELKPKTKTKQEIKLKTESSDRILDIPDFLFEEILKCRKQYIKNRNRRKKEFQDLDYICCSTYGRPRSRDFHFKLFKKLLKENNLPDIRWHDLRHSYATLLLKNEFNLKAISKILGHAKEIVTADNYIDNQEIIADGVSELVDYMDEVLPKKPEHFIEEEKVFDCSNLDMPNVYDKIMA